MSEPREWTSDEIRRLFLQYVWHLINYWDIEAVDRRRALVGLTHSILVLLDGESVQLPGFAVIPSPSVEDKLYHQALGMNWYPEFKCSDGDVTDIAGGLHDNFFKEGFHG